MLGILDEEDDAAAGGISKPGGGNIGIGDKACGNKAGAEPDIAAGGGADATLGLPPATFGTAPEPGASGGGASGINSKSSSPFIGCQPLLVLLEVLCELPIRGI